MENAQPEQSMEEILASIRRIISEDEDDGAAPAASARSEPARGAQPDRGAETPRDGQTSRDAQADQAKTAQARPAPARREPPRPQAARPEVVMTEDPEPAPQPVEPQILDAPSLDVPSLEASTLSASTAGAPAEASAQASAPGPAAIDPVGAVPFASPSQTESLEMLKKNVEAGAPEAEEALILDQTAAAAASQAFENLSQSVRVADKDSRTLEDIVVVMLKPMIKDWLDANLPAIVEEKVEQEVQRVARRRG